MTLTDIEAWESEALEALRTLLSAPRYSGLEWHSYTLASADEQIDGGATQELYIFTSRAVDLIYQWRLREHLTPAEIEAASQLVNEAAPLIWPLRVELQQMPSSGHVLALYFWIAGFVAYPYERALQALEGCHAIMRQGLERLSADPLLQAAVSAARPGREGRMTMIMTVYLRSHLCPATRDPRVLGGS
jgi:hypothetical protein